MTAISRALTKARPRWLVLTLACLAFVLLFGLPTIIVPLGTDQVLYSLGARTILDGGQLYRDFWEVKPPLVFLIYTVPFAIAGEHMEAIRVLDLVNTAVAMAAVFLLGRRFFSERAGIFAAAFYGFTYLTWHTPSLGEAESFMAAPLAFSFLLYRPEDGRQDAGWRAGAVGLLLGLVFALKATALVFLLGLPAAELLLRDRARWTREGALQRLALAIGGFLIVQVAVALYLAVAGVLNDFIDIQRHYVAGYNVYRYAPEGSHLRFLLRTTWVWITSASFLVVPAGVAVFFALFRPRQAGGVYLIALLSLLGVFGLWWQGKMFDYHWLMVVPLLALLAGYAVDQLVALFASALGGPQARAATALLAASLLALAFQPLLNTYDGYRVLLRYAGGSMTRREVEAHYLPLYAENHQLVDYVRANSGPDDRIFIWGFWPQVYFWLDRPLFDRFVANHGLRATWAPQSWRRELIDDLSAHPPRYIAVGQGDNQPWLVGTTETSQDALSTRLPQLAAILAAQYRPVLNVGVMVLYERQPAAVRAGG
jgi:4-amino-4-deoxy-L-arabinose transferase-like glycosyltransferase